MTYLRGRYLCYLISIFTLPPPRTDTHGLNQSLRPISIPLFEHPLKLLMPLQRLRERHQSLRLTTSKLVINSSNTPPNNRNIILLLPCMPLPLHLLHLIRLKIMNLDNNRLIVCRSVQSSASVASEANLAFFAGDGDEQGRFAGERLASAETD